MEETGLARNVENSNYTDIQLIEAWKADPGAVPVDGGASPGGPDHRAPMLVADAIGLAPTKVNHVPLGGDGRLLASVLSKVAFGLWGR